MIREKLEIYKENRAIGKESTRIAKKLAYSEGDDWSFNIGVAPSTTSVIEYAKAVGGRALEKLGEETSMEIAEFNASETFMANLLRVGINEQTIDAVPPPNQDVTVVFERTALGKRCGF